MITMKKILFTILLLAAAINVRAYDFSAVCSTGQTLYYNITSDSTVAVIYPGNLGHGQYKCFCSDVAYCTADPWTSYFRTGGSCVYGSYWNVDSYYPRPTGVLQIPSIVNGYSVTSIFQYAFCDCDQIDSVIIPSSVTTIVA